jgi:hypothetical protein
VSPGGSKVFVTGNSKGSGTNFDYATVAYDAATGAQLWVKRYNAPANKGDFAEAVDVSPNGSKLFVSGVSYGSTSGGDYATVAYDAFTGSRLWVSRYTTPGNGFDECRALRVSPDGSKVFATGDSKGSTSIDDYATVAYKASTGAALWVKRYNGPGNGDDGAHALAVSPDGSKVFITGPSEGSGSSYDYATIAYGASAGAKLWVRRYNGPANGGDGAQALGVSPDGSQLFITGSSGSPGSADYATVAYNASTGGQLWDTLYDGPASGNDSASSLVVGPGGSRVFVTGSSQGSTSGEDFATVAYSIN